MPASILPVGRDGRRRARTPIPRGGAASALLLGGLLLDGSLPRGPQVGVVRARLVLALGRCSMGQVVGQQHQPIGQHVVEVARGGHLQHRVTVAPPLAGRKRRSGSVASASLPRSESSGVVTSAATRSG